MYIQSRFQDIAWYSQAPRSWEIVASKGLQFRGGSTVRRNLWEDGKVSKTVYVENHRQRKIDSGQVIDGYNWSWNDCKLASAHLHFHGQHPRSRYSLSFDDWSETCELIRRSLYNEELSEDCRIWHFKEDDTFEHSIGAAFLETMGERLSSGTQRGASSRQTPKEKHCDKIALSDMVLIPGDGKPWGFWKLAKEESLITGNDGQTRGAVVRVASADRRPTLLRRQLQLPYPL